MLQRLGRCKRHARSSLSLSRAHVRYSTTLNGRRRWKRPLPTDLSIGELASGRTQQSDSNSSGAILSLPPKFKFETVSVDVTELLTSRDLKGTKLFDAALSDDSWRFLSEAEQPTATTTGPEVSRGHDDDAQIADPYAATARPSSKAHGFFSQLDGLLDEHASPSRVVRLFRQLAGAKWKLQREDLSSREHDSLAQALRYVADQEFSDTAFSSLGDALSRHERTLKLLRLYDDCGIIDPQHWSLALSRVASQLYRSGQPLLDANDGSFVGMYAHGLRVDSLLELWRHFITHHQAKTEDRRGHPRYLWQRFAQNAKEIPNGNFPTALAQIAPAWTKTDEPELLTQLQCSSIMAVAVLLRALAVNCVPAQQVPLMAIPSADMNHDLMQEAAKRVDDASFLSIMSKLMSTTHSNRMMLKVGLAKLSIDSRDADAILQLITWAGGIFGSVLGLKAHPRSFQYAGRYDAQLMRSADTMSLDAMRMSREWLEEITPAIKPDYKLEQLSQALHQGIERKQLAVANGQSIVFHQSEDDPRAQTSLKVRRWCQTDQLFVLDRTWRLLKMDWQKWPRIATAWWFHRLRLAWRFDPRHAVTIFRKIRSPKDMPATVYLRLANHLLNLAANTELARPGLNRNRRWTVVAIYEELTRRRLSPSVTTYRLILRVAIQFGNLETIKHWLYQFRRHCESDTLLQHETRLIFTRAVANIAAAEPHQTDVPLVALMRLAVAVRNRKLDNPDTYASLLNPNHSRDDFLAEEHLAWDLSQNVLMACVDMRAAIDNDPNLVDKERVTRQLQWYYGRVHFRIDTQGFSQRVHKRLAKFTEYINRPPLKSWAIEPVTGGTWADWVNKFVQQKRDAAVHEMKLRSRRGLRRTPTSVSEG